MDEKTSQQKAEELAQLVNEVLKSASDPSKPFEKEIPRNIMENVSRPSETPIVKHGFPTFKIGTFLDEMFQGGLPFASNSILTGLPNSGKSQLLKEIALRVAEERKVMFVSSEEVWSTETARKDLQSRFREMAEFLKLDWAKIAKNLFVIDTVTHAELRDWGTFVSLYRALVEGEKTELVLIDSMTLLEDTRGQLKVRVLELMRYNQLHGVTSILVNQRAIEESDTLAMAGGISLSHIVDIVFVLDYKKISSWDGAIKADIGEQAKQGSTVNFFRILKCRLCKFDAHYFKYSIDDNGLVRLDKK